jgi:hypothetical protein
MDNGAERGAAQNMRVFANTVQREVDDEQVAWSVGANQLDVAGVEAGVGHVHVFLPAQGVKGELTSDHLPKVWADRGRRVTGLR